MFYCDTSTQQATLYGLHVGRVVAVGNSYNYAVISSVENIEGDLGTLTIR